jgi:hypothetical protein
MNDDLPAGQILIGEQAYNQALMRVLEHAQYQLQIFDPDLSRGGFQSVAMATALRDFFAKSRNNRLQIIVHSPQFLQERCPRLLDLLRTYGHAMQVCVTDVRAHIAEDAFALADGKHYIHRFHVDHARFKYVLEDEKLTNALQERFEELLEAAPNQLSANTIGL